MQVILKENILGLGFKDEVVSVKEGYGRNYLIPRHKAVIASKSALKMLQEELKQRAKKIEKELEDAKNKANELGSLKPIFIEAKVSANGKIYGSIKVQQVVEEIVKQGREINKKNVVLKDVKTLGEHIAQVYLHKDVIVDVPFTVIAEGTLKNQSSENIVTTTEEK